MNSMITFAEPFWFVVGAAIIVLLFFLFKEMQRRRQKELARFASSHLLAKLCANVSDRRRTVKKTLLLLAIACCFIALARPQYGTKWVEVKRKGIDILFAVDTSRSMLAEDVKPNRLQRSKYGILDFVGQLEGDRVGLMPFAGSAFLLCPMTIDYGAFESSLLAVNTSIIPKGGTDLAAAIREAESVLSNEANYKILVLITDGEDLQGDALDAATDAAEKGMTIYTVGVGSSEGELIPVTNAGKTGFVKDASGKFITSRLDESGLTKIAEATSGLYVPLGTGGEGLQTIYQEKLSLIPKEELAEKRHKIPLERFVWPLGAALVLLMLEFLASGRKSKRSLRLPFIKTAGRRTQKAAAILFLSMLFPAVQTAEASVGETAYGAGDYLGAATYYSEQLEKIPGDARLHYNYGTAAYKNNLFEDAAESFSKALKSDDLALQEQAYYNRGNALFQLGTESLQTDKQHSIKLWEEAAESFDGALQLNSMNDDAGFNLDFVQKKLEELKKQQEQEQKDQQDQEKNDEQKDQDQDQEQNKDGEQDQDQKQDGDKQDSEKADGQDKQQNSDSSEKQSEEGQDEEQQEQAGAEEKDESQEKSQEAQASEKEQQEQQAEEARQRAARRREQGKMTDEEAMQLLNSLKDEEGELNFVPAARQGNADTQQILKDW